MAMQVTFLGTGTSQGVPIVGCNCAVCQSINPKDKRLRCSLHIQVNDKSIIIDTGPDFRQQLLANKIKDVDAILYTHEHKDHVAGLDDVRPINFLQQHDIPIYAEQRVLKALQCEFHYAFADEKYPGVPQLTLNEISSEPFTAAGIPITPIRAMHYRLPVLGFRVNNFAYVTDANFIEEAELEKLKNLDVLAINALRKEPHISHFTLQEAIDLIEQLQPKQAYLIHISHAMGLHNDINNELPQNVSVAYDRLRLNL